MTLKRVTLQGLFWSFTDNITQKVIQFIIGIILARLLLPEQFGLIGMTIVFINLSRVFVDSGLGDALIRKKHITDNDYSTVFIFNLLVSASIYFILFLASESIASFYKEPILKEILKVIGLILIIEAAGTTQRTQLTKDINFKAQAKVSVISSVVSGVIAIILAYKGFGVWSLVYRRLLGSSFTTILLFFQTKWIPTFTFDLKIFKELFSFSSKLLLSGVLNSIHQNLYLLIIGKIFSAQDLGFYTRADQFQKLPSQNISSTIQRVTYPVLSSVQAEHQLLVNYYKKIIRQTMYITFILMFGLIAISENMILVLIGEKWLPSVALLQLLCFVGMLYPLNSLNLNVLKVKGRSDLFLRLEIIKKIIIIPVVIIGLIFGLKPMICAMIGSAYLGFFLNSYISGKLINYSTLEQIKDILPSFILSFSVAALVFVLDLILPYIPLVKLIMQVISGAALTILICEVLKLRDYLYIKRIIFDRLRSVR